MNGRASALALVITTAAVLAAGCATGKKQAPPPQREVPLQQANSLEAVRVRAGDLRKGMSKAEVYSLLGAPARYGDGAWSYEGEGEPLVVRFNGDQYAGQGAPAKKR